MISEFVAIAGGPASGKSCYTTMAMQELIGGNGSGLRGMPESAYDREAHEEAYRALATGRVLASTQRGTPDAKVMRLKNQTREFRLYLYDPAGEEFTSIDRSSGQQFLFFEDLTGIVLVVDPLALPAFHEYAIARPQDVSAAMPGPSVPLGDIVGGLVRYERKFLKYGRTSRRDVPLAVVVAKADLPLVAEGVERSAGQNGGDGPLCRKALLSWGAANEVMWLEHEFRRIRYFSCSSLGRAPSETDSRPFVPQRVLPPLLWVMEESTKPG